MPYELKKQRESNRKCMYLVDFRDLSTCLFCYHKNMSYFIIFCFKLSHFDDVVCVRTMYTFNSFPFIAERRIYPKEKLGRSGTVKK